MTTPSHMLYAVKIQARIHYFKTATMCRVVAYEGLLRTRYPKIIMTETNVQKEKCRVAIHYVPQAWRHVSLKRATYFTTVYR